MAKSIQSLRRVQTLLVGVLFAWCAIGVGLGVTQYIVSGHIALPLAQISEDAAGPRYERAVGAMPLTVDQRKSLISIHEGQEQSVRSLKDLLLRMAQWSKDAGLSMALGWFVATLLLAALLRLNRRISRLGRSAEPKR